jgi:hypothetical protein
MMMMMMMMTVVAAFSLEFHLPGSMPLQKEICKS